MMILRTPTRDLRHQIEGIRRRRRRGFPLVGGSRGGRGRSEGIKRIVTTAVLTGIRSAISRRSRRGKDGKGIVIVGFRGGAHGFLGGCLVLSCLVCVRLCVWPFRSSVRRDNVVNENVGPLALSASGGGAVSDRDTPDREWSLRWEGKPSIPEFPCTPRCTTATVGRSESYAGNNR